MGTGLTLAFKSSPSNASASQKNSGGRSAPVTPPGGGQAGYAQVTVVGRVTAVSSTSITIDALGGAVTAQVTGATQFTGQVTSISGVKVGDLVLAVIVRKVGATATTTIAVEIQDPVSSSGGTGTGPSSPVSPGDQSPGGSVPGASSSQPGAPGNASAIATQTDPGLVDINVTLGYQGLQGAGTGMVLTSNGEVLTNNHVVEGATNISVTDVGNNKTYQATVVGYDRSQDVAVLQLADASGLKTVNLGDSSTVAVGEGVVAVGNAGGTGGTPSWAAGSVTATNQSITAYDQTDGASEQLTGLIETNADVVAGDSGGPLVDSSGRVIGMDTAGSQGFQIQSSGHQGFAIPIDEAAAIARQIEAGRSSSTVHVGPTAFLGIEVQPATSSGSLSGGSAGASGAEIAAVVPNGPAAQAGLAQGDTITAVAGQQITSPASLTEALLGETPGASVQVRYVDAFGQQHSTTVQLATGPAQ